VGFERGETSFRSWVGLLLHKSDAGWADTWLLTSVAMP